MVGTVMSLKMDWLPPADDTLFSLSVPMIICRISLLASPRTASRAWMCSSLQEWTDRRTHAGQLGGHQCPVFQSHHYWHCRLSLKAPPPCMNARGITEDTRKAFYFEILPTRRLSIKTVFRVTEGVFLDCMIPYMLLIYLMSSVSICSGVRGCSRI